MEVAAKTYTCKTCQATFPRIIDLANHVRRNHPKPKNPDSPKPPTRRQLVKTMLAAARSLENLATSFKRVAGEVK